MLHLNCCSNPKKFHEFSFLDLISKILGIIQWVDLNLKDADKLVTDFKSLGIEYVFFSHSTPAYSWKKEDEMQEAINIIYAAKRYVQIQNFFRCSNFSVSDRMFAMLFMDRSMRPIRRLAFLNLKSRIKLKITSRTATCLTLFLDP